MAEQTLQEQLVGSLQAATDQAKKLRMYSPEIKTGAELKATVRVRLMEMRLSIAKSLDVYNAYAHSTLLIPESENWYLRSTEEKV